MSPKAPETGFELAHVTTVEIGKKDAQDVARGHHSPMQNTIRKVAVLGAGTMGARIAAHVANAGFPCVLLDIVPPGTPADAPKSERNKIVQTGFDGLKKSKPAAYTHGDNARFITVGNFDDDLKLLADCDWIIEAVAENPEIKRNLLKKVEAVAR